MEISIGDYVLSGGEIPALVILDAILRLKPSILHNIESLEEETFEITFLNIRTLQDQLSLEVQE